MPKHIRLSCTGWDGIEGHPYDACSMTSITVIFEDHEANDFHNAKAKALGYIVTELCRYGLHEALNGIGILDENAKARQKEFDEYLARQKR